MSAKALWTLGAVLFLTSAQAGNQKGELVPVAVGGIEFEVPKDWALQVDGQSHIWRSPSGDHRLTVDAGVVQTKGMKAKVCVDKILAAMGQGEGWKRFQVAKNPAARRVDVDSAEDGSGEVETTTIVGCDGKTTWSVLYSVERSKRDTSWVQRVVKTLRYGKGGKK